MKYKKPRISFSPQKGMKKMFLKMFGSHQPYQEQNCGKWKACPIVIKDGPSIVEEPQLIKE